MSLLSCLFPLPSALVLRPSDLDRACLSLLAQGLSQTLSVSQVLLFKTRTFYLLSSLFSLLSSRFSLRSSLFSLLSPPVSLLSSLSALFPLLSSLSALFPLLSLLLIAQIALRTCKPGKVQTLLQFSCSSVVQGASQRPFVQASTRALSHSTDFDFRIRQSATPPTASTPCGNISARFRYCPPEGRSRTRGLED